MIWDFQDALSRRLLLWSVLSIIAGIAMLLSGDGFWRGFGLQAIVWGGIDAAIAILGTRSSRRRQAASHHTPAVIEREAHNLRKLLWINTVLDVLYIVGGFLVFGVFGSQDSFAAGNGIGIVTQGSFLFLFDLLHVRVVPMKVSAMPPMQLLSGPEHSAFTLQGGREAALLVHGFGGTPDEMRALAEALNKHGYTTESVLLPGFGADMPSLLARRHEEWITEVSSAIKRMQLAGYEPVIVVGYSMGAAAALAATQATDPHGLVLIAPFMWEEPFWWMLLEFFVRPFLPLGFRPLRKADFSNAQLRDGIGKFMPNINLDDSATQQAMRDFRVPLSLIDQIRSLSRIAYRQAARVRIPTVIIQGTRDDVVRVSRTKKLLARFPVRPLYVEVDSAHDLTLSKNPVWPQVEAAVLEFARGIRDSRIGR